MSRNKLSLLKLLNLMLQEITDLKLLTGDPVQVELKESLEKEVMALKVREEGGRSRAGLWRPGRPYQYSAQEKEEIRDEILRVQLIVSYRLLNVLIQDRELTLSGADEDDMNLIGQAIDSGGRIGEEMLDSHMETLHQIGLRTSNITKTPWKGVLIKRKDTMKITNCNAFTQENWSKRL